MKKIKDSVLPLSLMLLIPLINTAYLFLNNSTRGVHYLVTDIDKAVPFIKSFAIPYLLWYPFIAFTLIYFCMRYRKTYYKVISSLLIGMILCFIMYYFFQTSVPRPILYGNDFFTRMLRFIYSTDNPYNCFPSIHVLSCYIMIKGIKENRKNLSLDKIIIVTTSILIILSTQFIKQHVILDVFSALLLGSGIYKITSILSWEKYYAWIKKQYLAKTRVNST